MNKGAYKKKDNEKTSSYLVNKEIEREALGFNELGREELLLKKLDESEAEKLYADLVESGQYRCDNCTKCKNCAYCEDSRLCEDSTYLKKCYGCIKCDNCTSCTNCNNTSNSKHCHNVSNSIGCKYVSKSSFLEGCEHCIFCYGIKNKKYMILNIQFTEDEFNAIRKEWFKKHQ